jgi:septum formation protein
VGKGNCTRTIVLASASPRRKELLAQIGLEFEVEPSNYVEGMSPKLKPHELAQAISREKALAVAVKRENAIVIAADTFVVFRDKVMGKPRSEAEAKDMLMALSGKTHSVITGFTVQDTADDMIVSKSVETRIHVKRLTTEEVDAYVASKEPLDKAGAYGIQGLGAVLVDRIEGDYFNVMGLPLNALTESLKEFGINVL